MAGLRDALQPVASARRSAARRIARRPVSRSALDGAAARGAGNHPGVASGIC